MTTAQLGLLAVFLLQDYANAVEQLQIRLVRVLLDCCNERIRHGTRGLTSNGGIGARLIVLTSAPTDDISRACFGAHCLLVGLVPVHGLLAEAHQTLEHASNVTPRIRHGRAQQTLASFFHQVGLFEGTFGGIHVGKVENRARVTRVEDAGETNARAEWSDADRVNLVVDDVAALLEVDGINHFVIAIIFVAVEVFGLPTVTYGYTIVSFAITSLYSLRVPRADGRRTQVSCIPE